MRRIALISVIAIGMSLQQCDYPGPSTPVSSSSSSASVTSYGISVGDIAPPFSAKAVTGETVDLNKMRGKVVVLAFFGTSG